MRGSAKLADLASTILTAYGFDFDHLYSFLLKDKKGHEFQIQDPMVGEEPSADEVRIDELPLRPGGSMTYWYDFGDDWMFKVKLETIEPEDAKGVALGILDGSGEAPEQYPEF